MDGRSRQSHLVGGVQYGHTCSPPLPSPPSGREPDEIECGGVKGEERTAPLGSNEIARDRRQLSTRGGIPEGGRGDSPLVGLRRREKGRGNRRNGGLSSHSISIEIEGRR